MNRSIWYVFSLLALICMAVPTGCGGGGNGGSNGGGGGQLTATQISLSAQGNATAGASFNITVTALDASGAVVATYSGTVHFASSDGQAVLPPNTTLTNGKGTFPVTLKTAGGQAITATDVVTPAITGTTVINVNAGPAAQLSVAAAAAATVMIPFNVIVNAVDAYMNITTSYTGTVHFTSSDAQAALPINSIIANGTGSFSATLRTIGSQTVSANDISMASLKGTSGPINVVSNAATQLSVVPSQGGVLTRQTFNFRVSALDAANNVSVGYTGTVHFSSSDAQAKLPANSSLTAGTSQFSATLETSGPQTLTATDTSIASITGSASLQVSTASALTITSKSPPAGIIGSLYNPYTVRVCVIFTPIGCQQFIFVKVHGFPLMASGGISPYAWSWAAAAGSTVPPGLNISNPGNITCGALKAPRPACIFGTPTQMGAYNVVVTVTDSGSPAVHTTANYTITINNPPPPVISTTPVPPSGAVNLPYSFTFTASSGAAPLTWRVSAGTLPPGLTLSQAGVLSGTPTATGTSSFTLIAEDSLNQDSAPQDFTIQVFAHGFKPTGSMATPRIAHTATLLNTGKVLVAGGTDANGQPVATAELYDPTNGTFSPTGSMAAARAHFAATLLPNGKVLVTGGLDTNGNPLATAELYDPTTGTFSMTTGNMQFVHASHTATLLNTGKVLVAGWGNATAELFDPATGIFSVTGSMVKARVSHTATLLNSGQVLVTGGIQGAPPNTTVLAESELYDPTTGSFSQTLGNLATARQWHTASLLADGKVLVAGGTVNNSGTATATAELYDPTTQLFTATSVSMETARAFHTATVLNDGTILVIGGDDGSGPLATAEVYDPTAGTFSPTGGPGNTRESHTATLLNGGTVLVTGGAGSGPATAEVYQ